MLITATRGGVPVRCWTFPGNTADTKIIRSVKDDLAGWNLSRLVWVADRGFASAANRGYLHRGGGKVAGNLRVKEVTVAPGGDGDGDEGVRAQRFVVCHNPEQADRDARVRANLVEHLKHLITGSDAWPANGPCRQFTSWTRRPRSTPKGSARPTAHGPDRLIWLHRDGSGSLGVVLSAGVTA